MNSMWNNKIKLKQIILLREDKLLRFFNGNWINSWKPNMRIWWLKINEEKQFSPQRGSSKEKKLHFGEFDI